MNRRELMKKGFLGALAAKILPWPEAKAELPVLTSGTVGEIDPPDCSEPICTGQGIPQRIQWGDVTLFTLSRGENAIIFDIYGQPENVKLLIDGDGYVYSGPIKKLGVNLIKGNLSHSRWTVPA